MKMIIPLPAVLLVLAVVLCIFAAFRFRARGSAAPLGRLGRAGVITNWVLGVLYLPLGLFFSLSGMVSDGYIGSATPLQSALCVGIELMGFLCIPVCAGGILASALLRERGKEKHSFAIQFAGLVHIGLILLLMCLLEMA